MNAEDRERAFLRCTTSNLYEGTKDPARKPRLYVWQARNVIIFRFRFGNEQVR